MFCKVTPFFWIMQISNDFFCFSTRFLSFLWLSSRSSTKGVFRLFRSINVPYHILISSARTIAVLKDVAIISPCVRRQCSQITSANTIKSGRSENEVSYLAYFRFLSSHTTVHAVRHTAVSCLLSTLDSEYWKSSLLLYCRDTSYRLEKRVPLQTSDY